MLKLFWTKLIFMSFSNIIMGWFVLFCFLSPVLLEKTKELNNPKVLSVIIQVATQVHVM